MSRLHPCESLSDKPSYRCLLDVTYPRLGVLLGHCAVHVCSAKGLFLLAGS